MILIRHRKKVLNLEAKSYKENKEVSSLVFLRTKKDIA
nr:MAG TPA: hypothetical protein [Caudoviricetes sp.]